MMTTINTKQILMSAIGLLSGTTIASPLFFQVKSASANCQVSSTAMEVANLTNQVRAEHGLTALNPHCTLYQAAQDHTLDMVGMGAISHTGSDGSSLGTRAERVGYQYSNLGENVAQGQTTPADVLDSWMNSSGHRENILNPNFTEIGVGYENNYWTQVFGRSR